MSRFFQNLASLSLGLSLIGASATANAQHLWWNAPNSKADYTCIYGQIKVLVTHPTIYYCGCNWWPGSPAGGYTGIQDKGNGRHNTIFSIWDTSTTLHPHTVAAYPGVNYTRFGGEGTGAHTDFDYDWKVGQTYQFYATKTQDASGEYTLASVYFYNRDVKKWVQEATIKSPNGTFKSVKTFGTTLAAFLENWSGQDKPSPKLALYRLWMGTSPQDLTPVTKAGGDGHWGVLGDWFFLAEGDHDQIQPEIDKYHKAGTPYTEGGKELLTIVAPKLPQSTIKQLENLPRSPAVDDTKK